MIPETVLRQNIMVAGMGGRGDFSPHGGQEAEREERTHQGMMEPQRTCPSDPLLPAKFCLPKSLDPLKIAPQTRDQILDI
jgi:hypothetical protein